MSILYIVSTPIGNLEDLTVRAATVLRDSARVLAEDTRRTGVLFRRYGITTPLVSAHEHNEAARAAQVVAWLDAGEDLALVSDAGTPLVSDPGARLVAAVLQAGHDVVPVPGASAVLAALVASGMDPEPFTYFGFAPRSGRARSRLLEEVSQLRHTAVLYESPARLGALLRDLVAACGVDRRVAVARELTKLYETVVRGPLGEVAEQFREGPVRGEVVVVLAGAAPAEPSAEDAQQLAASLLGAGDSPRTVAKELARRLGISRNDAYALVLNLAGADGGEKD
ncbi:MAG TPA: 16S rRNA (cytidine(1402)-2'-O)-methyltransferase [Longimicrobiales bacterium]|nr:16S rRNA (cytidine(1402)-2'-O)-methyltransferase [Longimicrobiales bacterium]